MIRPLCLAVVGILVVLVPPAHAERWSAPEPRGDAVSSSFDPEPEPCGTFVDTPYRDGDITRLAVHHGRTDVVLRTTVVGIDALRPAYLDFPVRADRRTWQVQVEVRKGRTRASLWKPGRPPTQAEVEASECEAYITSAAATSCRGLSASLDATRDRVTVRLPRACLRSPRWVQAGLQSYAFLDDRTSVFDEWSPPGADDGDFVTPVYGERVRRPR